MAESILVVDDDPAIQLAVGEALEGECDVEGAVTAAGALAAIAARRPDVVLLDLLLPDMPGELLAARIREADPTIPLVVLSVVAEPLSVVRLMRVGSVDYLPKPFRALELRRVVRRAMVEAAADPAEPGCESLLGVSEAMTRLRERLAAAARAGRHLLLSAEPGFDVGDIARALARMAGPRTRLLHCRIDDVPALHAVLPPHARGVLCVSLLPGRLDEAVEILAAAHERQAAGDAPLQVFFDASPLAASAGSRAEAGVGVPGANLPALAGVESLVLPPLRARREDLPGCLRHMIDKHAARRGRAIRTVGLEALDLLLSYPWPGNLAEMDCVVGEIVRGGAGDEIDLDAAARLDAGVYAAWAACRSQRAGESLEEGLLRFDGVLHARRGAVAERERLNV